jgi:hypothetical protein
MIRCRTSEMAALGVLAALCASLSASDDKIVGSTQSGRHLFERETFGGNGRTCSTCHPADTGTVSPEDARRRFQKDPNDPLFLHDGSDDFQGNGVTRMLNDATVLVEIPLPENVTLADDPAARSVVLRRGIPTTLNTPALDPVLMQDGRQPNLTAQAMGAIQGHAQALRPATTRELERLVAFEKSDAFFSSPALLAFARQGVAPALPGGVTASEKRGRRFFEDVVDIFDFKHGSCAACHSGPMLNESNFYGLLLFGIPMGTRFQTIGVSELNAANNPVHDYVFTKSDGTTAHLISPDPGRALITGIGPQDDIHFDHVNAFKTPPLWGVHRTAPYFHDNSAKTLDDVALHYDLFFRSGSDLDGPGPMPPLISFTALDQADMVAYMRLLK